MNLSLLTVENVLKVLEMLSVKNCQNHKSSGAFKKVRNWDLARGF